jgi:uncharacterized protein (TIGR00730 family)
MKITVFGGSSPLPENPAYQFAYDLGYYLAQTGHTVLTGGYMGTMEATSKGAAEAGGHVIGVTCQEIENWRNRVHNPWVKEEWKSKTLQDRMIKLIDNCDLAIALPGGAGTLAEIGMMWNRIQIQSIPLAPIILVGNEWNTMFSVFFNELSGYIPPSSQEIIKFANTIEEIDLIINETQVLYSNIERSRR